MGKVFQRQYEDFVCIHCGRPVKGNGYTDHCPHCLFSLHVDITPGDRACPCHGILEPTGIEKANGKTYICYQCRKCGYLHRNKVAENDNTDVLIALSARPGR